MRNGDDCLRSLVFRLGSYCSGKTKDQRSKTKTKDQNPLLLDRIARCKRRSPRPLKVVSAKMARYIDNLTYEVKP